MGSQVLWNSEISCPLMSALSFWATVNPFIVSSIMCSNSLLNCCSPKAADLVYLRKALAEVFHGTFSCRIDDILHDRYSWL